MNLDKDNRASPKRGLNYLEPMHFEPPNDEMYATWDRLDPAIRAVYRESAKAYLETLKPAAKG